MVMYLLGKTEVAGKQASRLRLKLMLNNMQAGALLRCGEASVASAIETKAGGWKSSMSLRLRGSKRRVCD